MPATARELAEAGAAYADSRGRGAAAEPGDPGRRAGRQRATALRPAEDDGSSPSDQGERAVNAEEGGLMAELRMREALRDAMAEEMRRDEAVFVMGEDVGVFQGAFKVTEGLLDEFGERRVRDTPISENTIVGTGVGAAMGGLRPIVELMTVNFSPAGARPDRQPRRRDPLHVQRRRRRCRW